VTSILWTPLFPLSELPAGQMRARHGVLVVHHPDGALSAMENACPHQGYPLSTGYLQGCLVTCTWHNFKFDARTGACVMGDEAVRLHPLRLVDGVVEVQRDRSVDVEAAWEGLRQALRRVQMSRAAREAARLLQGGVSATRLLGWACAWDCDHAEYTPSHTCALAAELLPWLERPPAGVDPEVHRLQMISEVLELAARASLGLPRRARPEAEAPGEPGAAAAELRRRVEAEDAAGAEALVRGMVAAGWERAALERAFYPCLGDHLLDFGHALIYFPRMLALVEHCGPELADPLLGGLIFGMVNGTREDTLPPWSGWRRRYAAWTASRGLERAAAGRARSGGGPVDEALVELLVSGEAEQAFNALAEALERGPWEPALDALVLAGATALLRFDAKIDADPGLEEGWLDITHRYTAAVATREAVMRWSAPEAARLVLMMGGFLGLARGLAGHPPEPAAPPPTAQLWSEVFGGRSQNAIFFAHDVKTLAAAEQESARLGDGRTLQAAARYLRARVQERSLRKAAVEAVALVRDGRPPKGRSG